MLNDSVRKELNPKISPIAKQINFEMKEKTSVSNKLNHQITVSNSSEPKQHTAEITVKMTSPTLVDFQNKDATIPEWRLKVQNAVRKRQGKDELTAEMAVLSSVRQSENAALQPVRQQILAISGANALKAEIVADTMPIEQQNATLSSALQRIEESRQKFLEVEKEEVLPTILTPPANNKHPFYLASKQAEVAPSAVKASVNPPIKPKLAPPLRLDSEPLDTNKLPPLPQEVKFAFGFAQRLVNTFVGEAKTEKIEAKEEIKETEIVETEEIIEEIDDCAPLAMRFNAGLFDLIIGSFLSMILIAPFVISGGSWFTFEGFLAFLATDAIVMFIYLTTTIGFYGRTFGMRLFSLEVVDIEGDEYPTMHQAAVSSAVYILSLLFGGVGFLTILFNEDKRAAHDLVSKTIVVKEF
ncbi:hypothetical protein BH20ACI1_BH20ACI1_09160 [soil metagenome]